MPEECLPEKHLKEWANRKAELVKMAKFACDNAAHSYRGFHVGAAALGWSESLGQYVVAMAGNMKEREKLELGDDKRCAERGAIDYLLTKASDAKIVGLVVASERVGKDPLTDEPTKTLHCCDQCRDMLASRNCVDTCAPILIVNHAGDEDVVEEMSIQKMLDMYDTRKKSQVAA